MFSTFLKSMTSTVGHSVAPDGISPATAPQSSESTLSLIERQAISRSRNTRPSGPVSVNSDKKECLNGEDINKYAAMMVKVVNEDVWDTYLELTDMSKQQHKLRVCVAVTVNPLIPGAFVEKGSHYSEADFWRRTNIYTHLFDSSSLTMEQYNTLKEEMKQCIATKDKATATTVVQKLSKCVYGYSGLDPFLGYYVKNVSVVNKSIDNNYESYPTPFQADVLLIPYFFTNSTQQAEQKLLDAYRLAINIAWKQNRSAIILTPLMLEYTAREIPPQRHAELVSDLIKNEFSKCLRCIYFCVLGTTVYPEFYKAFKRYFP